MTYRVGWSFSVGLSIRMMPFKLHVAIWAIVNMEILTSAALNTILRVFRIKHFSQHFCVLIIPFNALLAGAGTTEAPYKMTKAKKSV